MEKTNAIVSILACAVLGAVVPAVAAGGTPLSFRGVVEGYYGRPWGTEGRLSLLDFMGRNGMNMFIYGPKDDPYHHSRWREPYPEKEMRDFAKLLDAARRNGVKFYWAIHLGGGFRKGSESDYDALFAKLGRMYDAGFRAFAVFFDDFGGADAQFHAEICNRILKSFIDVRKGCEPLVMCPHVYWGSGHPYQRTLGEKLDERVYVMWTGAGICSDIRETDVAKITKDLRRPPLVWWNWPVNDYCRQSLLLGRTYGLESRAVAGLVSNPMENCEASKIALYGVAKWCLDPEGFDSRRCWEESFAKLYPDPEIAGAMRVFAEHNSDQGPSVHRYRREESVSAAPLCAKAMSELSDGGALSAETARGLSELFKGIYQASRTLRDRLPDGRYSLGWEIRGWLDSEIALVSQGSVALGLLAPEFSRGMDEARAVSALRRLRADGEESARRHREKFAAATFGADSGNIKSPQASRREILPLVERMLTVALERICARRGRDGRSGGGGVQAFSTAKGMQGLQTYRDGKYAGISRVLEARRVEPGGTFGISIPSAWRSSYFHARLGSSAAVAAGVIEVSKDGSSWRKLDTKNSGEEMQTPLRPDDRWRFARYRNASASPVEVKINLFKFDVTGAQSAIDGMLEELSSKPGLL